MTKEQNIKIAKELGFEESSTQAGLFNLELKDGNRAYIDFREFKKDGTAIKDPDTEKGLLYAKIGNVMERDYKKVDILNEYHIRINEPLQETLPAVEIKQKIIEQKAVDKFNQEVAQAELEIIKKADDTDELIITEQVVGATPLVYQIMTKDKETGEDKLHYSLSVRGWIEAARRQGNIKVIDADVRSVDNKKVGWCRIRDEKANVEQIGVAERYMNEDFRITTLVSKAIRNALAKVVSPIMEQEVIKEAQMAKSIFVLKGFK